MDEAALKFEEETIAPARRTGMGIIVPIVFLLRPFKKPLEVFRCQTDGGLVTRSPILLSLHAGHRIGQPVLLKFWEILLVWIGIFK